MANWPHAPLHWFDGADRFIVTAGTLHRRHLLRTPEHLDLACRKMFETFDEYGWSLQAWSVFSNHYHVVPVARNGAGPLHDCLDRFQNRCSTAINRLDGVEARKVWFQYWDTRLTYEKSWLARLKYVVFNPVKHGLVDKPDDYPWCSARWFADHASRAFFRTVMSFRIDRVNVKDAWSVEEPEGWRG
jgi:putative transposase